MTALREDTGASTAEPARRRWDTLGPDEVRSVRWLDERTCEVVGLLGGVSRWCVPEGTRMPPAKDTMLTEVLT